MDMLRSYGPGVAQETLERLVDLFDDLRFAPFHYFLLFCFDNLS